MSAAELPVNHSPLLSIATPEGRAENPASRYAGVSAPPADDGPDGFQGTDGAFRAARGGAGGTCADVR